MSDQDDELATILNKVYDKQLTIYDALVLIHDREAGAERRGRIDELQLFASKTIGSDQHFLNRINELTAQSERRDTK